MAEIRDQIGPVGQWLGDLDVVGVQQVAEALGDLANAASSLTEDLTIRLGGASDMLDALASGTQEVDQSLADRLGLTPASGLQSSAALADRTLGDTTPTGIGLKPTGEQLAKMESDESSRSRLDRLFDKAFEEAGDVHDAAGYIGEAIGDLSGAAPSGHSSFHHGGSIAVQDQPPPQGPAVSDVVGSIAVTGVAIAVGIRHALTKLPMGE